jgi:hypothetical protein
MVLAPAVRVPLFRQDGMRTLAFSYKKSPEASLFHSRAKFLAVALSIGTLLIATAPSQAQDDMRARGDRACGGDAKRVCKKFNGQGDMVMLSCFQQNKVRLSRSCSKFLTSIGRLH